MAQNNWKSTGSQDWADVNNWSLGALPSSSNTPAVFDGTLSTVSPTANVDRTGATFQIVTKPSYPGNIGSAGVPLKVDGTGDISTFHIIQGTGTVYLAHTDSDFPYIFVDSLNLYNALVVPSGVYEWIWCIEGGVIIGGDATRLNVGAIHVDGFQASVTLDPGVGVHPARIEVMAGIVNDYQPLKNGDNVYVTGGSYNQFAGGWVNTCNVFQWGGTFTLAPTTDLTTGYLRIHAGLFTAQDTYKRVEPTALIIGHDAQINDFYGILTGSSQIVDFRKFAQKPY